MSQSVEKFLLVSNTRQHFSKVLAMVYSILICFQCTTEEQKPRILLFNKTDFYYHESTAAGVEAFQKLCHEAGIIMDISDDESYLTDEKLKNYIAVVFLNTAGNILNPDQEAAFEKYVRSGGGFMGIHTAIDTEHLWNWYGKLTGAKYDSQTDVRPAVLKVSDHEHPAIVHLDSIVSFQDEWFSLKDISTDLTVLLQLEAEDSSGLISEYQPVSWYHEFEGSKVFVTTMGHRKELYSDTAFLRHLQGGLKYVMGNNRLPDYTKTIHVVSAETNQNNFVKTSVTNDLYEPMEMDILPDGKIIIIERRGTIKLYNPGTGNTKTVTKLDVFFRHEEGLLGIAIDPDWERNHWIYMFYTPAEDYSAIRLSRFVFKNDSLFRDSENVILKVPTLKNYHFHAAGSLEFDADGLLYLSTGDNSHGRAGYADINEQPGWEFEDAQKSASNSMDLRGKVLRIKPLPDGSYLCPKGNLYVNDDIILREGPELPSNDPEYLKKINGRINSTALEKDLMIKASSTDTLTSVTKSTGFTNINSLLSSTGRPEIYIMGVRNPFRISFDDRRKILFFGDAGPDAGTNDSMHGPEGHDELNAAHTAGFYGWPYFIGCNRPYRDFDFQNQKSGPYFDPLNPVNNSPNNTGSFFLPPARPPLIWYTFRSSKEFPLISNGTRCIMAGPAYYADLYPPGTRLPDRYNGNVFIYDFMRNWIMAVDLDNEGNYIKMEPLAKNIQLARPIDMLIDHSGALWVLEYGTIWYERNKDASLSRIDHVINNSRAVAGTDPETPPLQWDFYNRNMCFYNPGEELPYRLKFAEADDARVVSLNISIDKIETDRPPQQTIESYQENLHRTSTVFSKGQLVIDRSDCRSCHDINRTINGPSYTDIAKRYKNDRTAAVELQKKIINGGSGKWGERFMIAHPQISDAEAKEIVDWIFSLHQAKKRIPNEGRYNFRIPENNSKKINLVVFHAVNNKGAGETVWFRPALLQVENADFCSGRVRTYKKGKPDKQTISGEFSHGNYFGFQKVHLKGIQSVDIEVDISQQLNHTGGGILELRLDETSGPVIGTVVIPEPAINRGDEIQTLNLPVKLKEIKEQARLHDLFFIIKNDEAGKYPVLGIDRVKFNLER